MKKIFFIAILFLATSAFCEFHLYLSGGYSQTLTGTTPVGDLSVGTSFDFFDSYDMRVGIDFLHFQIAPSDRFQTVSDESLFQLPSLILALPFAAFGGYDCSTRCGLNKMALYARIIGVMGFILHGSLYFPVVPNSYFGIVNKHRFVTEIITKGWHKKSFTFQDDIGLRFQINPDDFIIGFFADGGFRFEKNFSRDLEKKWFVQAGLTR